MRSIGLKAVLSTAAVGAVVGMSTFAGSASAAPALSQAASFKSYGPVTSCVIYASVTVASPGTTITITSNGCFSSGETVVVTISDPVTIGSGTAASNGTVSIPATIPSNEPLGDQTITATGQTSGKSASVVVDVVSSAPATTTTPSTGLAFTGADVAAVSGVGAVTIGAGGALLLAARRRRRHSFSDHS